MEPKYMVGVVGGACAGSEIAHRLLQLGMEVVVFEQGSLPYGKIEDGLPRWHAKLQDKEKQKIDEKINQKGIHFVPNCVFGQDITLRELREVWKLPLVVLANGAWKDREMRVAGLENVLDGSFAYQNPFVYWFNHYPDQNYRGPHFDISDGPIVIGGGLASIDVAKICQFQLAKKAFKRHGIEFDAVHFDHYGIAKTAEAHGLSLQDLKIKPAQLFYRKRVEDMPLVPLGEDPDPQKLEKAKLVREKLIANATEKYGFQVFPLASPVELEVENGSVAGVRFQKNTCEGETFKATSETFLVPTSMVISSIGSIPQPLPGIPMVGELYDAESYHTGALNSLAGVYCVGNAITGRGNIKDSFKNAARLGTVMDAFFTESQVDYEKWFKAQREEAEAHVAVMFRYLEALEVMDQQALESNRQKVQALQNARGYDGNYQNWRERIISER